MNEHLEAVANLHRLPDWDAFPLHWISARYRISRQHLFNLIETEEIDGVDFRGKGASRSCIRVPRYSFIAYLDRKRINRPGNLNDHNGHSRNGKAARK